jgi:methylglyoxal synthase
LPFAFPLSYLPSANSYLLCYNDNDFSNRHSKDALVPTIALIAHDGKKDDMIRFVREHRDLLERFHLIATGTTGERIAQATGLPVERMRSGPLGGDAQIAARVAEGQVIGLFFLVDPLYAHPHEPDIAGLLRICNVYDVPLATNEATGRLLLHGLVAKLEGENAFEDGGPTP